MVVELDVPWAAASAYCFKALPNSDERRTSPSGEAKLSCELLLVLDALVDDVELFDAVSSGPCSPPSW